jgi:hypothetical protein
LKYFTEKYRSGDEFGFGGEGIYWKYRT